MGPVVRVLVCWHGLWQWAIALAAQLVARSSLCLLLSLRNLVEMGVMVTGLGWIIFRGEYFARLDKVQY